MRFNDIKAIPFRIQVLATGNVTWIDNETNETEDEHFNWHMRWVVAGIHSRNWWWVRRFGKRPCGCTINPITHRLILIAWRCPEHGDFSWEDDNDH